MDTSETGGQVILPLSPMTPEENLLLDDGTTTLLATLTQVADVMSGLNVNSPQPKAEGWPGEPDV